MATTCRCYLVLHYSVLLQFTHSSRQVARWALDSFALNRSELAAYRLWPGVHPCHICTETGSPLPHLHRDRARRCHICTGTGLAAATSATGTESNKQPHLSYNAGNMQRTIRDATSYARTTRDMTDGGFMAEGEYRTPCKTRRYETAS